MKVGLLQRLRCRAKAIKKAIKPYLFRIYPFRLRQYVGNNQVLVRTKYGFPMYTFGNDVGGPGFILTLCGFWEPHLTSLLYRKTKPGMIAVDIGANIGYFSALFASCGAHVHAFEPNPAMSQIIYKNIFINNLFSIIIKDELGRSKSVVNQCAVGAQRGTAKMNFAPDFTGTASLTNKALFFRPLSLDQAKSVEIDIITLDEYSKINCLQSVDIIKIDVEGFEEEALRGGENLIRRSPELMLCMEYTRGCYSSDFIPWLEKYFSKVYLPKFGGQINFEFLRKYQEHEILQSELCLDVVLIRGRRFT